MKSIEQIRAEMVALAWKLRELDPVEEILTCAPVTIGERGALLKGLLCTSK